VLRVSSTKLDMSFVQTRTTVRLFYNLSKTPFLCQPAYEKHDNEIKQSMLTVHNRHVNFQTYEYKDINEEDDRLKYLLS
jgi:hypothetical protein